MTTVLPAVARLALLASGLALSLEAAEAQSAKIESVYVVLGPQGAVARAIVAETTRCPAITIDGSQREMNVRAAPDAIFAVLVCEMPIPASATAASIDSTPLPLPRAQLTSIAAFGDTGCRLKAAKAKKDDKKAAKKGDRDDDEGDGKFQDCNDPAAWPFAQVAASIAAAKPDLVIHVGDYLYRESACPPGDAGCARSPYGDDWPTWKADFFAPAAPALRAAPWIVVRGNHEICKRAGAGYFRLLDPSPASSPPPCIDLIPQYTVTLAGRSFIVLDSSNADDACKKDKCDAARYAKEFSAMQPRPGSWLLTHRPIWGFRTHRKTINESLQQALAAWNGKLPDGITLALAGHIHVAEVLSFADKRTPQLVLGTGGTLLAGKIKSDLAGEPIGGTTVAYGRADHRFGFAIIEPVQGDGHFSAAFRDNASKKLFGCQIGPGEAVCN